jgi:hypothetical protein
MFLMLGRGEQPIKDWVLVTMHVFLFLIICYAHGLMPMSGKFQNLGL